MTFVNLHNLQNVLQFLNRICAICKLCPKPDPNSNLNDNINPRDGSVMVWDGMPYERFFG